MHVIKLSTYEIQLAGGVAASRRTLHRGYRYGTRAGFHIPSGISSSDSRSARGILLVERETRSSGDLEYRLERHVRGPELFTQIVSDVNTNFRVELIVDFARACNYT